MYHVGADPKPDIWVGAIAKNPNGRRPAMQSIEPEEVSIVRVAKKEA
jgi:hypothetical protein